MTQEEGNKLIAEFVGYNYAPNINHESGSPTYIKKTNGGNTFATIDMMKYHSSWDWLMPVIKKIEEWVRNGNMVTVGGGKSVDILLALRDIDLPKTWLAVTKFIQWYNTTKK